MVLLPLHYFLAYSSFSFAKEGRTSLSTLNRNDSDQLKRVFPRFNALTWSYFEFYYLIHCVVYVCGNLGK